MDIWRSGYVNAPIAEVLAHGLERYDAKWLPTPDRSFAFHADPFGVVRGDATHVFFEALDYRNRRGRIEVLTYDRNMALVSQQLCLSEPWHLSYPVPIEWDGDDFLLPEAHRSGRLTLYRATEFPTAWEAVGPVELPHVPVDATPCHQDGLWWLFYSPAGSQGSELRLAFSEVLHGPWRAHPKNPVWSGTKGSRPGGKIVRIGSSIVLPVQDCSATYGGAIRPLTIGTLTPDCFEAELGDAITPPPSFAPFTDGLHTLSECGPITLFDTKRIDRSIAGKLTGLVGKARRAAGQWIPLNDGNARR